MRDPPSLSQVMGKYLVVSVEFEVIVYFAQICALSTEVHNHCRMLLQPCGMLMSPGRDHLRQLGEVPLLKG